jgi:F-type H+-transporting ATPase subunit b
MLDVSPNLVLASAGIFLFMLIALNAIVYKPLIKFMADRDNSINDDLKNASSNSDSVEELKAEANKIISEAKAEANKLREKATTEAKELSEQKVHQKNVEIESEMASFRESLEKTKAELKASLQSQSETFKDALKVKMQQI